jgi:nucleotide-binding universal stress UspA family protein
MIGVDGRPGGRDAIALAKQLASTDARMTLAHVYGSDGMLGRGGGVALIAERENSEQMLRHERVAGSLDAELVTVLGPHVGRALHVVARRQHVDLVVVGTCHRGSLGRVLVGNDALATLNGAPCAVAIAPAGYERHVSELATLGVGEDASPESALALAAALEVAERHGAAVRVLSVVSLRSLPSDRPVPSEWTAATERLIREERSRLDAIAGVEGDAVYGEPSDELDSLSESVDLLVVGSRGYGPLGRLMSGSTSNYLARHVHCPLLVLRRPKSTSEPTGDSTSAAQEAGEATR